MKATATKNLLAILLGSWISVSFAIAAETPKVFDIEQQPLATALNQFAQQSDRQILFSTEVVNSKRANAIRGELDPEVALQKLLKGTGLSFRVTVDHTILVDYPHSGETANVPVLSGSIRLAQVGGSSESSSSPEQKNFENSSESFQKRIELEQVVVTGTHIRGVQDIAQPSSTITREEIDKAGFTTMENLFEKLPENFNTVTPLGRAAGNLSGNTVAGLNWTRVTAIDLRGLGAESTLTLINGRRRAGSIFGRVVDVSAIPLSAIERVDVVTGGASAL